MLGYPSVVEGVGIETEENIFYLKTCLINMFALPVIKSGCTVYR